MNLELLKQINFNNSDTETLVEAIVTLANNKIATIQNANQSRVAQGLLSQTLMHIGQIFGEDQNNIIAFINLNQQVMYNRPNTVSATIHQLGGKAQPVQKLQEYQSEACPTCPPAPTGIGEVNKGSNIEVVKANVVGLDGEKVETTPEPVAQSSGFEVPTIDSEGKAVKAPAGNMEAVKINTEPIEPEVTEQSTESEATPEGLQELSVRSDQASFDQETPTLSEDNLALAEKWAAVKTVAAVLTFFGWTDGMENTKRETVLGVMKAYAAQRGVKVHHATKNSTKIAQLILDNKLEFEGDHDAEQILTRYVTYTQDEELPYTRL